MSSFDERVQNQWEVLPKKVKDSGLFSIYTMSMIVCVCVREWKKSYRESNVVQLLGPEVIRGTGTADLVKKVYIYSIVLSKSDKWNNDQGT